jgi:hypothetical protein
MSEASFMKRDLVTLPKNRSDFKIVPDPIKQHRTLLLALFRMDLLNTIFVV